MRCPKCGFDNQATASECTGCGHSFKNEDATMAFTPADTEDQEAIQITPEPTEAPMLIIAKGASTGETFSIETSQLTLGRDPSSDIFLNDVTVSRNHAKITREGHQVWLMDVGSLNGTYVNNKRVDRAALHFGDEIQIGKFKLIFVGQRQQKGKSHGG